MTNSRRAAAAAKPTDVWSRVWEWPIPPGVYVAPEVLEEYQRERAFARVPKLSPTPTRGMPECPPT